MCLYNLNINRGTPNQLSNCLCTTRVGKKRRRKPGKMSFLTDYEAICGNIRVL